MATTLCRLAAMAAACALSGTRADPSCMADGTCAADDAGLLQVKASPRSQPTAPGNVTSDLGIAKVEVAHTRWTAGGTRGPVGLGSGGSGARFTKLPGRFYAATLNVGGTPLLVQIDTGSADQAVRAYLDASKCPDYYEIEPGQCDSSLKVSDFYVDGDGWGGITCLDSLSMGGLVVPQATFAAITSSTNFFSECQDAGIVGMGYRSDVVGGTFFTQLLKANPGMSNIFAIQACPGGGNSAGGMTLGGYNKKHYTGSLYPTPITSTSLGFYCIHMTSMVLRFPKGLDGESKAIKVALDLDDPAYFQNCDTIVDSGNDVGFAFAPVIWKQLKGFAGTGCRPPSYLQNGPTIVLQFSGGFEASFPPEKYAGKCANGDVDPLGHMQSLPNNNNLGQLFLESYYTVFDRAQSNLWFADINCGR